MYSICVYNVCWFLFSSSAPYNTSWQQDGPPHPCSSWVFDLYVPLLATRARRIITVLDAEDLSVRSSRLLHSTKVCDVLPSSSSGADQWYNITIIVAEILSKKESSLYLPPYITAGIWDKFASCIVAVYMYILWLCLVVLYEIIIFCSNEITDTFTSYYLSLASKLILIYSRNEFMVFFLKTCFINNDSERNKKKN